MEAIRQNVSPHPIILSTAEFQRQRFGLRFTFVADQAVADFAARAVCQLQTNSVAVEDTQVSQCAAMARFQCDGRVFFPDSFDQKAVQFAVGTAEELQSIKILRPVSIDDITRITVEIVGSHNDGLTVFDEQIVFESFPEGIACDGNTSSMLQVDIDLDVTEDVASDGDVSFLGCETGFVFLTRQPFADHANVGAAWRFTVVLQRTTCDGDFIGTSVG